VVEPERGQRCVARDVERGGHGRRDEPGWRHEELELEAVRIGDQAEAAARLRIACRRELFADGSEVR
jgi:hypothetical protein